MDKPSSCFIFIFNIKGQLQSTLQEVLLSTITPSPTENDSILIYADKVIQSMQI